MNHNEFHNLREKLYDMEMPVGVDLWKGIDVSMRRQRKRRSLYYVSSVAAVVLLALLFFVPGKDVAEPQGDVIAQVVSQENVAVSGQVEEMAEDIVGIEDNVADDVSVKKARAVRNNEPSAVVEPVVVEKEEEVEIKGAVDAEKEEATEDRMEDVEKGVDEKVYQKYVAGPVADLYGFGEEKPAGRKYAIAFSQGVVPGSSASVAGSRVMASSAFGGAAEHSYMVEQISDTKYSLPVNVGVQFQFPVGENMAVGVGVNYSMLKSKYDCLIDKVHYNVKQKLHYIGVPVNVYGLIADRNNFSFYVNAGVTLEKGLRAVYELSSYRDSQKHKADIDGVQFSVNAGLGVEYKFNNSVGLYFEPNLVYFTNSEVMYSIRTDQPFQVKADIGFRFHF